MFSLILVSFNCHKTHREINTSPTCSWRSCFLKFYPPPNFWSALIGYNTSFSRPTCYSLHLCDFWSLFYLHSVSTGICLDEGFCNEKADGNYKNPDTCYGFISCSGGILHKMPCSHGLMFNEVKNICDYPENTECEILEGVRGTPLYWDCIWWLYHREVYRYKVTTCDVI